MSRKKIVFASQVIFQRLYATNAADDKCTLYADRNLINRRNVKADVTKGYAPAKQMFLLAVKARIVAATMFELGMDQVDGRPTRLLFTRPEFEDGGPSEAPYLRKIASSIVDKYILNESAADDMNEFVHVTGLEESMNAMSLPDGQYSCDFPWHQKSFK